MANYNTSAEHYENLGKLRAQIGMAAKHVKTHEEKQVLSKHLRDLYETHRDLLDSVYGQGRDLGLFNDGVWYHQQVE